MAERIRFKTKRLAYRYHGPVELELKKAVKFQDRAKESRQHELGRLLDTVMEKKAYCRVSEKAGGWVMAASRYYNDGYEFPEPDRSNWLSMPMQQILGAPTMKQFLKKDFGPPSREFA